VIIAECSVSVIQTSQLMLYREIIAVCSEIHTKHINVRCGQNVEFLEAFAKFRKSTMSSVVSVCPSIRIEQLGSNWTDFHEISYLSISGESVKKIQVSLQSDQNNGTLHEFQCTRTFMTISR
jgi:hypothetical protein